MVNENSTSDALNRLQGAREARMPWLDVASHFTYALRRIADDAGRKEFAARAASVSGYSGNMLRRYSAVSSFLEGLPPELTLDRKIIERSFANLEVVMRIHSHEQKLGRDLIVRLRDEKIPVSHLRSQLKNLAPKSTVAPTGISAGLPPKRIFSASPNRSSRLDDTFVALRRMLPELSGRSVFAFGKPEGAAPIGLRCDAVAWLDRQFTTGDGFEIVHAPRGSSKAALSDAVSRAMTASSLFRKFFLVFSWDSEPYEVQLAIEALKKFGASTVGVVHLGQEPFLRKKAATAAPEPDRRHLLKSVCPGGRWARS